jgi:hypothetical protein
MNWSSLRRHGRERGAALVEAVVALPFLVALLIGTADFARVFYVTMELTNAARAGAQYGAATLGAGGDPEIPNVESFAQNSINLPGAVARARRDCQCAQADGSFPDIVRCSDPAATVCPSPKFRVVTVTVTVTMPNFRTISMYAGIGRTFNNLSRSAVMRVTE